MKRLAFFVLGLAACTPASAENLYNKGNWPAMASDRRAEAVGDSITILVFENSSATNSVGSSNKRKSNLGGSITAGSDSAGKAFDASGGVNFGSAFEAQGQTSRAGRIVAQISATVDSVLPNGDLQISGWQRLRVNGEATNIKVSGRVRRDDISGQNSVQSSRIANAVIEYDGKGFVSKRSAPGFITRILDWLGL